MGAGDRGPAGPRAAAGAGQDLRRLVHRRRQDIAVLGQREMGGLDLQCGAQLVERDDRVGVQARDARATVRGDRDEALVSQRAQRRADGVARRAVGLNEVGLDQPRARIELRVEDLLAQDRGDAINSGRAHAITSTGGVRSSRLGTARTASPARITTIPATATAPGRSPRTMAPSSVAVTGAASVSVATSLAGRWRSPAAKSR